MPWTYTCLQRQEASGQASVQLYSGEYGHCVPLEEWQTTWSSDISFLLFCGIRLLEEGGLIRFFHSGKSVYRKHNSSECSHCCKPDESQIVCILIRWLWSISLMSRNKHTKAWFQYKFSIQILKYTPYLPKNVFTTQKLVLTLFHSMSIWGACIPPMAGIFTGNGAVISGDKNPFLIICKLLSL